MNNKNMNNDTTKKNYNTIEQFFNEIKKSKFITESQLTTRVLFCFTFMALL